MNSNLCFRILAYALFTVLVYACQHKNSHTANDVPIAEGKWRISFIGPNAEIPVSASFAKNGELVQFTFHNSKEDVELTLDKVQHDTIIFHIPTYGGSIFMIPESPDLISGYWTDSNRVNHKAHFVAEYDKDFRFTPSRSTTVLAPQFKATFQTPTGKEYPAILLLDNNKGVLEGTFLTETGDYRFLEGNIMNDQVHLSSFDGSHLWYFVADIVDDSLNNGFFFNDKQLIASWTAYPDISASLQDPWNITTPIDTRAPFTFSLLDQDGIQKSEQDFQGSPTIYLISGSWCPNCKDAAEALQSLRAEMPIEVVHIYFEKYPEFAVAKKRIDKMLTTLQIQTNYLFGGIAQTTNVLAQLPSLNTFSSYPTIVFCNNSGEIQSIYTGFYGPSSPIHLNAFIQRSKEIMRSLDTP